MNDLLTIIGWLLFWRYLLAALAIWAAISFGCGLLTVPFSLVKWFSQFAKDVGESRRAEAKAKAFLESPEWKAFKWNHGIYKK